MTLVGCDLHSRKQAARRRRAARRGDSRRGQRREVGCVGL